MEQLIYIYFLLLPFDAGSNFLLFNKRVQYCDFLFIVLFFFWCWHKIKEKPRNLSRRFHPSYFFIAPFI
ncbi:MAG: hypothetical protein DRP74_01975, partial [Candidatus Omnitrophota bacterium]